MNPYLQDADLTLYQGDALEVLQGLPDESVHMCVTSPPFYGLRDYGTGRWEGGNPDCDHKRPGADGPKDVTSTLESRASNQNHEREPWPTGSCGKCGASRVDQQIGLEATPEEWVAALVGVFREVRRVLRSDGTCWVEVGDSYAASMTSDRRMFQPTGPDGRPAVSRESVATKQRTATGDLKPKDLIGAPWMLAFALRADGWYLRSDVVWSRPNPMPESVTDRPTKSHSYVFLLSKRPRYFFDQEAVREKASENTHSRGNGSTPKGAAKTDGNHADGFYESTAGHVSARNVRSVWSIPTQSYSEAHFATFPEELVRRCILAGSPAYDLGCPACGLEYAHVTSSGEVCELRRGLRSEVGEQPVEASEVLQSEVLGSIRRPEQVGSESNDEGVHLLAHAGASSSVEAGAGDGASSGDGEETRSLAEFGGSRPSQEREEGRQPDRESGSDAEALARSEAEASGDSDAVSPLLGTRNGQGPTRVDCERCGAVLVRRSAVVLDCFAGSGTTGLVARKHGRRSILIELSAEYCGLVARRTQQLSLTGDAP